MPLVLARDKSYADRGSIFAELALDNICIFKGWTKGKFASAPDDRIQNEVAGVHDLAADNDLLNVQEVYHGCDSGADVIAGAFEH